MYSGGNTGLPCPQAAADLVSSVGFVEQTKGCSQLPMQSRETGTTGDSLEAGVGACVGACLAAGKGDSNDVGAGADEDEGVGAGTDEGVGANVGACVVTDGSNESAEAEATSACTWLPQFAPSKTPAYFGNLPYNLRHARKINAPS